MLLCVHYSFVPTSLYVQTWPETTVSKCHLSPLFLIYICQTFHLLLIGLYLLLSWKKNTIKSAIQFDTTLLFTCLYTRVFFSAACFSAWLCLMSKICVQCFREDWKPVLTINSIVYGLQYLFLEPNPEDPLNKEAAEVLQSNKRLFEQNVAKSMRGGHIGSMYFERCLKWPGGAILEEKVFEALWTGSVLKQQFLVWQHTGVYSQGVGWSAKESKIWYDTARVTVLYWLLYDFFFLVI